MSMKISLPLTTGRTKDIEKRDWNEFALATTVSLSRIYERLRKRSARRLAAANDQWGDWFYGDDDAPLPEDWYDSDDHKAYLKGVRDALNAVAGRAR